ncbi:hypothetical protein [Methylobacterium sp. J-070]|uniref:hypothetical protein n=1 Tax=Methylobacterium sp. J-070 TaxID=2836650 RepID=UPI001FB959E1|nr:hypothetical protein [Methylobacterium sp. J-070]MCJ2048798.1 hypothetical protein [Methylobacterium sp. J-070]
MRQDQVNSIIAKHIRAYHEGAQLRAGVYPEGYAMEAIDELAQAGFEITSKFPDSAANSWVLAQVIRGDVKVIQDEDARHQILATATASLVRWGGRGPGEQREISVSMSWGADEGFVAEATAKAMALALRQARDAAMGFANAAAAALQAPEPAAA